MSHLCIINPNSSHKTTQTMAAVLSQLGFKPFTFRCVEMAGTKKTIVTGEDRETAAAAMCEFIKTAWAYDAFVIACHGDPGVPELKALTSRPVIGMGECSLRLAAFEGRRFSVISPHSQIIETKKQFCRQLGLEPQLCSIQVPIDESPKAITEAARKAACDGAECIVLGCGNYTGLAPIIQKQTGVAVLDPLIAACFYAASLISYNQYMTHDRRP